jgi:hypothetical protein
LQRDCTTACQHCTRRFPGTNVRPCDDGTHHQCSQCQTDPAYKRKFSGDNGMLPGDNHLGTVTAMRNGVLFDHTLPPLTFLEAQLIKPMMTTVSFTIMQQAGQNRGRLKCHKKTCCFERDTFNFVTDLPRTVGENGFFLLRLNGGRLSDAELRETAGCKLSVDAIWKWVQELCDEDSPHANPYMIEHKCSASARQRQALEEELVNGIAPVPVATGADLAACDDQVDVDGVPLSQSLENSLGVDLLNEPGPNDHLTGGAKAAETTAGMIGLAFDPKEIHLHSDLLGV